MSESSNSKSKRPIVNDENDPNFTAKKTKITKISKKKIKTNYAFQPIVENFNKYSNASKFQTKSKSALASSDPNVIANAGGVVVQEQQQEQQQAAPAAALAAPAPVKSTPMKSHNKYNLPSSEDHVYWEMTPKAASIKAESLDRDGLKSKIVPSSPLIGNGKVVSDTDPLIPLLKKYNATFDNLDSQTPIPQKHARSSSDSESIDVGNEQISPSFARTRSEGLQVDHATYNKLSLNKKKLLKSGISRFRRPSSSKKNSSKAASPALTNLNDMVKNNNSLSACTSAPSSASSSRDINKLLDAIGNSFRLQSPDIPGSVADQIYDENKNNSKGQETSNSSDSDFSSDLGDLSELIEKKTISQLNRKPPVNELIKDNSKDDDFDDDKFSDEIDMVELDTFFKKKSQNESTAMKGETKKEKIPTTLKKLEDEFGDHAFSSDNSTEDDDEELCQIMNKLSQKKSIAAKKSPADSETLLARSDRNNVAIFQTGVKRFDTPDYLKSFKDNKTEQKNLAKSALQKPNCHRYQVLDVLKAKYTKNNRTKEQLIITVMKPDNSVDKVLVRDLWATLEIAKNDVIHIIGSNPKIVDNDNNLLIWNPDIMISATNTGQALDCSRKSVLNSKLAFPGDSSVPLIVGNIVHSLFQECLSKNNTSLEFINESLENLLQSNLIDILSINETLQRIKDEVNMHIPYIQNWYSTFINDDARAIIVTEGQKEKSNMSISNILDVEENIWSPMFGIRGLIDVTVEAHLKNSNYDGKFVTPLEIKTGGREYLNHRAQTSLYTLLINERYDMDSKFFLLLYSKLKDMKKHDINPTDLKLLINIRNKISQYLQEGSRKLPPLLKQSQCDRCFAVTACMTMNKLMENGNESESGLKEGLYEAITGHLKTNPYYIEYFNYWDNLITKEESVINSMKKELWVKTALEREENGGKAIGNLVITEVCESEEESNHGFMYTFSRAADKSEQTKRSLLNSQLTKHDRVIISDEDGHFALSSGWIISIREGFITIKTDRRIINSSVKLPGFAEKDQQIFQSVLHSMNSQHLSSELITVQQSKTYRIDKDEMFHGLALARYNLLNLFLPDEVGDPRRRRFLVDMEAPKFSLEPLPYELPESASFNSDQIKAFDKILKTKDYSLILGMPGTGKTTAIAQIIRYLVKNNSTVLLASYTHSAVDNILIKLKNDGIPILRTGHISKVHPEVQKFVPNSEKEGSITVNNSQTFKKAYIEPAVVATTCLGINDVVFNHRKNFDYCIIDEASQVSMPVCLGPLRFCDKFVLVGDHYQLPPLVVSQEARNGGLDKSLFRILSERFPESVVDLSYQYRMCADIMLLSNTLIYEGRLKCGSEEVAKQSLLIPFPDKLTTLFKNPDLDENQNWLKHIFEPKNKVVFLNHDELPAFEKINGEKIENPTEAELIRQIVESLIYCGVNENSIGVMSLYRAQLRILYRKLSTHTGVEILTADQFQGRDKDCIIISMVRSNDTNTVGELLKEWRRINVAITRARSKLIILGSRKTMDNLNTLQAFMSIIETRGWMYNIPKGGDGFYNIFLNNDKALSTSTQLSSSKMRKNNSQVKKNGIKIDSKIIQNRPVLKNIVDELLG